MNKPPGEPSTEEPIKIPDVLPVLPLKDTVVFPYIILPLSVGRDKSVLAVDRALAESRRDHARRAEDGAQDNPGGEDLYEVGTAAVIMRMLKLPDGRIRILVQGLSRARVQHVSQTEPFLQAKIERIEEPAVASNLEIRGPDPQRQGEPRPRRHARQGHLARGHGDRRQPRRPGPPRRPRRQQPRAQARTRRRASWRRSIPSSACTR